MTALSEYKQKMFDKATAEYKTFVQEQIDKLLTDTEGFVKLLKEGKLEEAKKVYPLIRMSYERSEPIAESFVSQMSKLTSVWQTIWTKIRQKKVGQDSTVSSVSFGKTIQLKELKIKIRKIKSGLIEKLCTLETIVWQSRVQSFLIF